MAQASSNDRFSWNDDVLVFASDDPDAEGVALISRIDGICFCSCVIYELNGGGEWRRDVDVEVMSEFNIRKSVR